MIADSLLKSSDPPIYLATLPLCSQVIPSSPISLVHRSLIVHKRFPIPLIRNSGGEEGKCK
jgi:hypothetical protein